MPERRAAIFDFDGTLTSRDTMAGFFVWRARTSPLRGASIGLAALALLPLMLVPDGHRRFVSCLLWVATVGLSPRAVARMLARYGAELAATPELWRPGARALVEEHRRRGDEIWIASASCRTWIRCVVAAAGVPTTRIVASGFGFRAGGLVMSRRASGVAKVALLSAESASAPVRWTAAYGDSVGDVPMLALAERQGVVGATRGARAARRTLGPSASAVH